MKNIEKMVRKHMEKEAGGRAMKVNGVSDPRFSRVVSKEMFAEKEEPEDEIEEAKEKEKNTPNPNKHVKRLKHMKGAEKKK